MELVIKVGSNWEYHFWQCVFSPACHFFNCYLIPPLPTLGHYWGDSLTNLILITFFNDFDLKVTGNLMVSLGS